MLADGTEVGVVVDMIEYPASMVLLVKGAQSWELPLVEAWVSEVDVANGVVRVASLEGLEPIDRKPRPERAEADEWTTPIREYLRKNASSETTMSDLLSSGLGLEKRDWTRACQTRVGYIMSELGFERVRRRLSDGSRSWIYQAIAVPTRDAA